MSKTLQEAVDPETGEIVDETALQKIEALTAQPAQSARVFLERATLIRALFCFRSFAPLGLLYYPVDLFGQIANPVLQRKYFLRHFRPAHFYTLAQYHCPRVFLM